MDSSRRAETTRQQSPICSWKPWAGSRQAAATRQQPAASNRRATTARRQSPGVGRQQSQRQPLIASRRQPPGDGAQDRVELGNRAHPFCVFPCARRPNHYRLFQYQPLTPTPPPTPIHTHTPTPDPHPHPAHSPHPTSATCTATYSHFASLSQVLLDHQNCKPEVSAGHLHQGQFDQFHGDHARAGGADAGGCSRHREGGVGGDQE